MGYSTSATNDSGEFTKEMLYDLRQFYAKIVGEICMEIARARNEWDFQSYFRLLEDLHAEVNQKFDKGDAKKYRDKRDKALKTIEENEQAFLGQGEAEEKDKVYQALKKLEMFLKKKMEKQHMFGSKFVYDEDEI